MKVIILRYFIFNAVPEDFGGVQTNATAYYGSVYVNAVNGTIVFPFQLMIDVRQFHNDIETIEITLTQKSFAGQRLFSFSGYQQQEHFSLRNHGSINVTFITSRFVVFDDLIIYKGCERSHLSNIKLPSTIELDLSVTIRGNNSEEHAQLAVATVTLIQDPPQGCSYMK